jgi:hypothetical protein
MPASPPLPIHPRPVVPLPSTESMRRVWGPLGGVASACAAAAASAWLPSTVARAEDASTAPSKLSDAYRHERLIPVYNDRFREVLYTNLKVWTLGPHWCGGEGARAWVLLELGSW